jgi:hypothetical protein
MRLACTGWSRFLMRSSRPCPASRVDRLCFSGPPSHLCVTRAQPMCRSRLNRAQWTPPPGTSRDVEPQAVYAPTPCVVFGVCGHRLWSVAALSPRRSVWGSVEVLRRLRSSLPGRVWVILSVAALSPRRSVWGSVEVLRRLRSSLPGRVWVILSVAALSPRRSVRGSVDASRCLRSSSPEFRDGHTEFAEQPAQQRQ